MFSSPSRTARQRSMIQSYICNLATLVPWDLIVWQPSWISAILRTHSSLPHGEGAGSDRFPDTSAALREHSEVRIRVSAAGAAASSRARRSRTDFAGTEDDQEHSLSPPANWVPVLEFKKELNRAIRHKNLPKAIFLIRKQK
jgi:hypothetical protein